MGVSYWANAIIGVKIDKPYVFKEDKTHYCCHNTGNNKYCPECGVKALDKIKSVNPIIDALDRGYHQICMKEEVYVGLFLSSIGNCHKGNLTILNDDLNIPSLKLKLKEDLKELYNERNFGLWNILDAG